MKHMGMKVWALVIGAVAYLFSLGSPAKGETQRGIGTIPSAKEPTVPRKPQVPPLFAPPDAARTVLSYGAPQAGLGATKSSFSARGPWSFMPDGSLRQKDKRGGVLIIKRSGEVTVFNSARQQVQKKNIPAAAQFYRVMRRAETLRQKQAP